jgi:hypothetical protein
MFKSLRFAASTLVLTGLLASGQQAKAVGVDDKTVSYTVSDYGSSGVLQTPTARHFNQGDLIVGGSSIWPYNRYFITLQAFPWLQSSFRYTIIRNRLSLSYDPSSENYADKSLEMSVRLQEETKDLPQVTVGLRDLGGSGFLGSEYIVASKRYYDFDFSVGMMWGKPAQRLNLPNPFGVFYDGFKNRKEGEEAGEVTTSFFRGENVSLFGGITYSGLADGLDLKVEFDPNDYADEPLGNSFKSNFPFNFGADYWLTEYFNVGLSYQRGNRASFRVLMRTNFDTFKGIPKVDDPPPKRIVGRPLKELKLYPTVSEAVSHGALPYKLLELPDVGARQKDLQTKDDQARSSQALPMQYQPIWQRLNNLGLSIQSIRRADYKLDIILQEGSLLASANDMAVAVRAGILNLPKSELGLKYVSVSKSPLVLPLNLDKINKSIVLTGQPFSLQAFPKNWERAFNAQGQLDNAQDFAAIENEDELGAVSQVSHNELNLIAGKIFKELKEEGLEGVAFDIQKDTATIHFVNSKYRNEYQALGRVARAVARHAPMHVEVIKLVRRNGGVPVNQATIYRRDLERADSDIGSVDEIWARTTLDTPQEYTDTAIKANKSFTSFSWGVLPKLRQHIGGTDTFYAYQVWLQLSGSIGFGENVRLSGALGRDVYNTFGDLKDDPRSSLPHVRSDIVKYLQGGKTWVNNLALTGNWRIADDVYFGAGAGLYELMYAGIGAEVLYRPTNENWAVGLNLDHVRKRDFDGKFRLLDYKKNLVKLTYYQAFPDYNTLMVLSMGNYLAGDKGATVQLQRRFDNGTTVGVFATKTDVSAAEFGEGSFDKGAYVVVPMDLFFTKSRKSSVVLPWRPLTRDGGQDVGRPLSLYGITGGGLPDGDWRQFLK